MESFFFNMMINSTSYAFAKKMLTHKPPFFFFRELAKSIAEKEDHYSFLDNSDTFWCGYTCISCKIAV